MNEILNERFNAGFTAGFISGGLVTFILVVIGYFIAVAA